MTNTEEKKKFKGSLSLDWINKDKSLYYEIDESEGRGLKPKWVDKDNINVCEPRILNFIKSYGDESGENILIRGDNLLVLRTLIEQFKNKEEKHKVKLVYIDPPYNTGNAFEKYDDNLRHSEWLTMMRDRLVQLKRLMRRDGFIVVQVDDEEQAYLRILLDEIFGRDNFVNQIAYERSGSAGLGQGAAIVNTTEYIFIYKKELGNLNDIRSYEELDFEVMKRYNKILVFEGDKKLIEEIKSKTNGEKIKIYIHKNEIVNSISLANFEQNKEEIKDSYLKSFDKIFRTTNPQKENEFQNNLISKMDKNHLYSMEYIPNRGKNKNKLTRLFYLGGGLVAWLKDSAVISDNAVVKANKLTDMWTHKSIPKADLANEGGIEFKRSKKPEQLIKRVIELTSNEGDLILDSFAGSGTTGAVAQKMNRRWIMVEMGKHAEELCIPRLNNVIKGSDQSGVSKELNWKGGGGFKYYKLAESLIQNKDINWNLTYKQIAEVLFYIKDFKLIEDKELEKKHFYLGENQHQKGVYAICSVSKDIDFIKFDEYCELIEKIKTEHNSHELYLYTNKAVNVRKDDQDEKVLIKKIPQTILKKFKMI